jgi:hypothetical protein
MSKPKEFKLTDLQLLILSKASQRNDHAIELPPNRKGGAAAKVVKKLIDGKLAKEVAAKPGMPVWRRDDESRSFALIITHAAFEVLGIARKHPLACALKRRLRRRSARTGRLHHGPEPNRRSSSRFFSASGARPSMIWLRRLIGSHTPPAQH